MNDLEIICLALAGECVNIESECLLWSKIKTDYSKVFKNLPHRTMGQKQISTIAQVQKNKKW